MKTRILFWATFFSAVHFASAQTNLAFPGASSFRDAVSQSHRTIVFDVGGL
jgi:hypothetical protein